MQYIAILLVALIIIIYPFQIIKITLLLTGKASIIVFIKYSNFTDILSLKIAAEVTKYVEISNYIIDLE